MITLTAEQTATIKQHALACYPEEMCGVIVKDEFVPLPNIADDPLASFKIDENDLFNYLGDIKAVVHSHCRHPDIPAVFDIRTPSLADVKGQEVSGVPWLIVGTEGINVMSPLQYPRQPNQQYLERPFIWFINDCYTIVEDYYHFELGINLPPHPTDKDYSDFRQYSEIVTDYIQQSPFQEKHDGLHSLKNGDLLLVNNLGKFPNHICIYHDGNIIHQDMMSVKISVSAFVGRIHGVFEYVS